MHLFDSVKKNSCAKVLLISPDHSYRASDLIALRDKMSHFLLRLKDKRVSLKMLSNMQLAKWLILLDGLVESLCIIPPEASIKDQKQFLAFSESDFLLIDTACDDSDDVVINVLDVEMLYSKNVVTLEYSQSSNWIIATSGTTGMPKLVQHNLASLTKTVKYTEHDKKYIWGLIYALNRFAGLQVFLQSVLSGHTLVITKKEQTLAEMVSLFVDYSVTCLSATSTLWRKLLMTTQINSLHLEVITLGGEIADQNILTALKNKFPKAKIRHIYASTEAGAGFSVSDVKAGFPLKYIKNGLSQVSLAVSKGHTLLIRSDSRAERYIGDAQFPVDADGFLDTGDKIMLRGARYYFIGRENGMINVGGDKVQPEVVERVLLEYPGVILASVTAKKSAITGNLVQATIVIASNISDKKKFIQLLKEHCKRKLADYMVPALIKVVDNILTNSTGKLIRK